MKDTFVAGYRWSNRVD